LTSNSKKVLVITYYWPPSGGSGVQRWLKFVKYLPSFGWEPHVFTPENPSFSIRDESLLKDVPQEAEVIRFPIWEPYELFFKFLRLAGVKKNSKTSDFVAAKNKSVLQTVAGWIRGNFFIPDPRVFWVTPSFRFLNEYIQENSISTIVTTGPPHSVHLIGLRLKKKNPGIRWLADFRDPWSEWGLLDSLHTGKWARKRHQYFERSVLTSADEVLTITPFYVNRFQKLSGRKVHLLTNGFDEDNFKTFKPLRGDKFIICHVGIVNERCDPRSFLTTVEQLVQGSTEFSDKTRVEFVGEVHIQVRQFIERSETLKKIVELKPSVPHKELIKVYEAASLLVLILTGYKDAEGYLPGKLFEYIATGQPVLGVGPVNGDAAVLINESKAGRMIADFDVNAIKEEIMIRFNEWTRGQLQDRSENAERYSRKSITARLTDLL
jgi:hypothetical protein